MASPDHDAIKDSSKKRSSAAVQVAGGPEEESTPAGELLMLKKRGKKRRREENEGKEDNKKAALTESPVERPSRERKSVVRYAATATQKMLATKAVKIQQGPGKRLKDIPNVTFKLSKRKSDETLLVLHKILFGRKTNVHFLKRNILQFSGFVWSQNEEKDRSKIKEKLNKCNRGRLLEFCDLLDVYIIKATTKKEEISEKLLEFLESPHATREAILSEKNTKGKKRRRVAKGTVGRSLEEASSNKENKRSEKADKREAKKGRKKPAKAYTEDLDKGGSVDTRDESEDKKDDAEESSEHPNSEAEGKNEYEVPESMKTLSDEEEMDAHEEPKSKEKSPVVKKVSRTKSKEKGQSASSNAEDEAKVPSESKTSKGKMASSKTEKKKAKKDSMDTSTRKDPQKKREVGSDPGLSNRSKKDNGKNNAGTALREMKENKKQIAKTSSKDTKVNKKQIAKTSSKDTKVNKKQIAKTESKNAGKKGKHEDAVARPRKEELYAVVSEILKEVDFNVVTLADIIRQLGAHFDTDLMHRKAEIKDILGEVINSMTDEEDADDDDVDGGAKEEGDEK